MITPLILDSVTHLTPEHRGRAAHCASHGGVYAGYYAAKMGLGAVILNDAGIGREQAGLAGVVLLDGLGVPAAAIAHSSARIGDGGDGWARGILSHVNAAAVRLGLVTGMTCSEALQRLSAGKLAASPAPPAMPEQRVVHAGLSRDGIRVIVMDSISLVTPDDAGQIVVAASHGGLLGGRPKTCIKYPVFGVVTNDAGFGIDNAGISRLSALEARGIAGACVSAFSARIGDGRSTLEDGVISALNAPALRLGGLIGQSCVEFVATILPTAQKVQGNLR